MSVLDSIPVPEDGHEIVILDVPYGDTYPKSMGAVYVRRVGHVISRPIGEDLPYWARGYAPQPYSLLHVLAQIANGHEFSSEPTMDTGKFDLYEEQEEVRDFMLDLYEDGRVGALNASDTGTGKTPSTVAFINATSAQNVLVVAPKSVLPGWRDTLRMMGDGGKMWLLINYESMRRLLDEPASAKGAKKQKTKNKQLADKGIPIIDWDIAVFDESQYLGNPVSQASKIKRLLVAGSGDYEPAFDLCLSATPGKDPTKTTYLYEHMREVQGMTLKWSVGSYERLCQKLGIGGVTKTGKGSLNDFSGTDQDILRWNKIVFQGDEKFGVRIESPFDQARELLAVDLTPEEQHAYDLEWQEFLHEFQEWENTPPESRKTPQGLAVQMRFRQKAGLIRVPHTAEAIKQKLEEGYQVAVSCEFSKSVERIAEAMEELRLPTPSIFTGKNQATREQERLRFQRGENEVILFSVAEGINLHANQKEVGNPSSTPRSLIIAEPRWSPQKAMQIEGRTQRNREKSTAWYAYAAGTIEGRVMSRMLNGMNQLEGMRGGKMDEAILKVSKQVLKGMLDR